MKWAAYKIVQDNTIAEDLVHDSIANLIQKMDTIRDLEQKRLTTYIITTVRNHAINFCIKREREKKHTFYGLDEDVAEDIPDSEIPLNEKFEAFDEYRKLADSIEKLPERERELLHLKYNLQYDDTTIGRVMGIKKASVRQYLTRARRLAKAYILEGGKSNE
jgi:RNA polymerase sigma factor (sigma-70 family)